MASPGPEDARVLKKRTGRTAPTSNTGSPLKIGPVERLGLVGRWKDIRNSHTGNQPGHSLAARRKKTSRARRDMHSKEEVRQDPVYRRLT